MSPDGETNYGAYYITADCHTIMPYIKKMNLVHFAKAHFHQGKKQYRVYSFRMIKHIPAAIRLLIEIFRFRHHVQKIRKQAFHTAYRDLIESDPYLKKYYHQKAGVFIKQHGLENFTKEYLEQFLWAAYFTDPREVSTSIFLGVLLTLIVPSYSFVFQFDKLIAPFKKRITCDTVTEISRGRDKRFTLKTASGKSHRCDILVLATPMNITNTLVTPQKIKGGINVNYYHIRGKIKKKYDVKWYSFFPIKDEAVISREANGTYLYFYGRKDRIVHYFDSWEVITKDAWRPALFFLGDEYIDEQPEPNLFLANDHNVPSTEDAFINGHYVANLILKQL